MGSPALAYRPGGTQRADHPRLSINFETAARTNEMTMTPRALSETGDDRLAAVAAVAKRINFGGPRVDADRGREPGAARLGRRGPLFQHHPVPRAFHKKAGN